MKESSLPLVLFIVFLVLKLTGNIDWSWWWVTSPLWIHLIFVGIPLLVIVTLTCIERRKAKRSIDIFFKNKNK